MRNIVDVAGDLGWREHVMPWGPGRAKVDPPRDRPRRGRLVLVSGMSPTPAGEGKTTTTIALAQGLRRLGHTAVPVLRQPSVGPVFGMKGGGTGGGRATIEPATAINLHLCGDLHAVAAAHNLLAAVVDERFRRGTLQDPSGEGAVPVWRRVVDVNDRALRSVRIGIEGAPRDSAFDITAASEVMAVLALASDRQDLERRLARMIVAMGPGGVVTAADMGVVGALSALLHEALWPNLVQCQEGGPAIVHAGPFANIAHGTCSRIAMRAALDAADIALVEAGFGFDLGGEKFLDIVCRDAEDLWPSALVIVVTERAIAWHGLANLERHITLARRFGFEPLVVLNHFRTDPPHSPLDVFCEQHNIMLTRCDGFGRGGEGAEDAARALLAVPESAGPRPLYGPEDGVERIVTVLAEGYGAGRVELPGGGCSPPGLRPGMPVCVARTPLSFTHDKKVPGAPTGFTLPVREFRVSAGAGFVVALCGEITTMPGLPADPAALQVFVDADGVIQGVK